MTDKLQRDKFELLLKEVLEDGYGEVICKVKVADGEVVLIELSKSNTYKVNVV
jgi:hypothetical protein